MPQNMSTPFHCPGFESLRDLSSFTCNCPKCGKANEIFSDEFDRPHNCSSCGEPIDFSQCKVDFSARDTSPR
mgnify:CR=1 FL=1